MTVPTIVFCAKEDKTSKRTKLTPVYIRIRNGNLPKTERKLNVFIEPDDLKSWDKYTGRLNKPKNRVNAELEKIEGRFENLRFNMDENEYYSLNPDKIAALIIPGYNAQKNIHVSLLSYAEAYLQNVITPSASFKNGTKINYAKSLNHLSKFLTFKQLRNLSLSDFCSEPIPASVFKEYLTKRVDELAKAGMSETSATSIIKNIKPIIKRAIAERKVSINPFTDMQLKYKSPSKPKLTVTEVKSLQEATFHDMPKLEIYRDKFLFAIYTGLSYADIEKLKRSDIIISSDGYFLDTFRTKTGFSVTQFLVAPAIEIYKKYENHIETMITETVLPTRSLGNYNINLKFLALKCKITKPCSTHVARHSHRQLIGDAGVADVPVQNSIMGWSGRGSMSSIYNEVTVTKLMEARDTINNYLQKHFLCK